MEQDIYWIWISRLKNIKRKTLLKLVKECENPEEIYNMKLEQFINKGLEQSEIKEIQKEEYKKDLDNYKKIMEKNNIEVISINSKYYPEKLKRIIDPPIVLYVKGNKEILNQKSIAVIRLQRC